MNIIGCCFWTYGVDHVLISYLTQFWSTGLKSLDWQNFAFCDTLSYGSTRFFLVSQKGNFKAYFHLIVAQRNICKAFKKNVCKNSSCPLSPYNFPMLKWLKFLAIFQRKKNLLNEKHEKTRKSRKNHSCIALIYNKSYSSRVFLTPWLKI